MSLCKLTSVECGLFPPLTPTSRHLRQLVLKPHHYAVMRVGIVSPEREGLFVATAFVHTEFEQPTVPFRLRIALGSLSTVPATVTFEKTFPVS